MSDFMSGVDQIRYLLSRPDVHLQLTVPVLKGVSSPWNLDLSPYVKNDTSGKVTWILGNSVGCSSALGYILG